MQGLKKGCSFDCNTGKGVKQSSSSSSLLFIHGPQFKIWVILYISIFHIGRYFAQKRFLNFIRLASFSVCRLTLIGENDRRNGNGGDQGGSYQCCRSIAIIDYLSSKFILCRDIFNSYNPRDSENKLSVLLPWTMNYYTNTVKFRK